MRVTGAQAILEILAGCGVRYLFGNPGTTELPLTDAMVGRETPQYVLALQEVPRHGHRRRLRPGVGHARRGQCPRLLRPGQRDGDALQRLSRGHAPGRHRRPAGPPDDVRGADSLGRHGRHGPPLDQMGRRGQPDHRFALGGSPSGANGHDPAHRARVPLVAAGSANRRGRAGPDAAAIAGFPRSATPRSRRTGRRGAGRGRQSGHSRRQPRGRGRRGRSVGRRGRATRRAGDSRGDHVARPLEFSIGPSLVRRAAAVLVAGSPRAAQRVRCVVGGRDEADAAISLPRARPRRARAYSPGPCRRESVGIGQELPGRGRRDRPPGASFGRVDVAVGRDDDTLADRGGPREGEALGRGTHKTARRAARRGGGPARRAADDVDVPDGRSLADSAGRRGGGRGIAHDNDGQLLRTRRGVAEHERLLRAAGLGAGLGGSTARSACNWPGPTGRSWP